jgi:hypothetical protein
MSKTQVKTDKKGIDRRAFLRASAGVLGTTTVGGASMHVDQLAPVGKSKAFGPLAAGAVVVGAAAGMEVLGVGKADGIFGSGDTSDLSQDTIENEVHSIAATIDAMRTSDRDEIQSRWTSKSADNNPTAHSVFMEAEFQAADAILSGNEFDAKSIAQNAVDKHVSIATYNHLMGINEPLIGSEEQDGLVAAFTMSLEHSTGQFVYQGTEQLTAYPESIIDDSSRASPVPESEVGSSGEYAMFEVEIPGSAFPMDLAQIDEIDGDSATGYVFGVPNGILFTAHKGTPGNVKGSMASAFSNTWRGSGSFECTHPDRSTAEPIDLDLHNSYNTMLANTRSTLLTQVETYVDTLNNKLAEGVIDPNDLISPQTAIEKFANTGHQSATAARLAFTGAAVPTNIDKDLSFKAKVSHPDLASDSLWGDLWVALSNPDASPDLQAGMTITASEYDMAYLTFDRKDTGEPETRIFTGDSDLQILDMTDMDGEQSITEQSGQTVENGEVLVWKGQENVPEPIEFPADHSGWILNVVGAENRESVPVGNVTSTQNDNGVMEYYAPVSSLSEGEAIEDVILQPSVGLEQPTTYIQNPGDVSTEDIEERVQTMNDLAEAIEDLEDSGVTGGGGGLLDFGSVGGKVQKAIAGVIALMVGLAGLNAASG